MKVINETVSRLLFNGFVRKESSATFTFLGEPLHILLFKIDEFVTLGTMKLEQADQIKRIIKRASTESWVQVLKSTPAYEGTDDKIRFGVFAYIKLNSEPNNADSPGTLIYSYNAFSYENRECLFSLH